MAKWFRKMVFELSTRLEKEQCESIRYLARLPNSESSCGVSKSHFQLYVLSSLEANGHISPHDVDYLLELLSTVHREDLLPIVTEYKQLLKKKKKKERGRNKCNVGESDCAADDLEKKKKHLLSLYTLLITHITGMTQVVEMLREKLDKLGEDEVDRVIEQVAEDGQTFTNDLQEILGDLGIESKRNSTSSSSEEETSTRAVTMRPKKPKPLPRAHKPAAESQLSVPVQAEEDARVYENLNMGTQEEGETRSSSFKEYVKSSLPWASMPRLNDSLQMEGEDDNTGTNTGDSGISDWIGHRASSEGNLLETQRFAPERALSDGDARLDGDHCEKAAHIYTALMKRKESVPQYEPVSYGSDVHRQ